MLGVELTKQFYLFCRSTTEADGNQIFGHLQSQVSEHTEKLVIKSGEGPARENSS